MRIAAPPLSCRIYTPIDLAEAMVKALGDRPGAAWLEPSHGKGVFVAAISTLGVEKERIVAIDLDPTSHSTDRLATTIRGVDFLRWAHQTPERFDKIIGNPPFVSIAQLPRSLQKSATSVLNLGGQAIGKGANLWYAFALSCLKLLRNGGDIALVLPSAAEFADYSAEIRGSIAGMFASFELYRCKRPLFDEVQDGTVVALARGYGRGPGAVARRWFKTAKSLINALSQSQDARKGRGCATARSPARRTKVALESVAQIGLGGVTGDVRFFLMNEERRISLGLPVEAMTPVLSKARHLRAAVLTDKEWHNLKSLGERVWLFNPPDQISKCPKVKKYLQLGPAQGGCNRRAYKVSIRDPWYGTPMPPIADAFLSGMSQHRPWLCINESERVNATNTLYVVRFLSRDRADWYMWALAFLSSEARQQVCRLGRRYPDGLIKYEPGSIRKILLPEVKRDVDHRTLYLDSVSALLSGNLRLSSEIADSVLQ